MPRLGVLGTLVWDTIRPHGGVTDSVEDWGGIAYSLVTFSALGPRDWTLVPIIKIGADLRERADLFLEGLERVASTEGLRTVPEPNNRVELRYHDPSRRCETLTGGVPGWCWDELAPLALSCDALYVNFIAGWELGLETARALGHEFRGPLYGDLHSLMLGKGEDGVRTPRPLPDRSAWLTCFDFVQMNEQELRTLAGTSGEPLDLAEALTAGGPAAVLVTLGEAGAVWAADEALAASRAGVTPPRAAFARQIVRGETRARAFRAATVDPTGCGDVWGMTCFATWLGGATLQEAVQAANRSAARKLRSSGTAELADVLRGTTVA